MSLSFPPVSNFSHLGNQMGNSCKIKIIAFFARNHGLQALESLLQDKQYEIVYLFTHKQEPLSVDSNRILRPEFQQFSQLAQLNNIPLQTVDSKDENILIQDVLEKITSVDFILSVSWRYQISTTILSKAQIASINLHRGKLPEYPGALPILQAIKKNDDIGYITAHKMIEKIDSGDILKLQSFPIKLDKHLTLEQNVDKIKDEITPLFGTLLLEVLNMLKKMDKNHG